MYIYENSILNHFQKFECTDCGSTFRHRFRFTDHMYMHSGFTFPCDQCDVVLRTPMLKSIHQIKCFSRLDAANANPIIKEIKAIPADPNNSTIVCQLCEKSFADVDSFENHFDEHGVLVGTFA